MDLEKGHMLAFVRVVLCKFSDVYRSRRRPYRAILSLVPAHVRSRRSDLGFVWRVLR